MKKVVLAQMGFTLIELMIVVEIIGVLAAVSLPAYQNYINRAKMTEVVRFTGPCQRAVEEYYQTNPNVPAPSLTTAVFGCNSNQCDATGGGILNLSEYVLAASVGNNGEVVIDVQNILGLGANAFIDMRARDSDGFSPSGVARFIVASWECFSNDIPFSILPPACRNAAIP